MLDDDNDRNDEDALGAESVDDDSILGGDEHQSLLHHSAGDVCHVGDRRVVSYSASRPITSRSSEAAEIWGELDDDATILPSPLSAENLPLHTPSKVVHQGHAGRKLDITAIGKDGTRKSTREGRGASIPPTPFRSEAQKL